MAPDTNEIFGAGVDLSAYLYKAAACLHGKRSEIARRAVNEGIASIRDVARATVAALAAAAND